MQDLVKNTVAYRNLTNNNKSKSNDNNINNNNNNNNTVFVHVSFLNI